MYAVVDWVAIGVALTLFLIGIVLVVWPSAETQGPRTGTKVLLVFLRLTIAWHFFVEGMDKLHQASWTSENYLREATGPLAPHFRELAGDRLLERLTLRLNDDGTVPRDGAFPPALDVEWQAYLDAFCKFYGLDDKQTERAQAALKQTKKDMELQLSKRSKSVEKIASYPPPLPVTLTIPERIAEYHALVSKVREAEEKLLLPYGSEEAGAWKTAKADATRWRVGLQRDLVSINKEMKRTLQNILLDFAGESLPPASRKQVQESLSEIQKQALADIGKVNPANWDEIDRVKDRWADKTAEVYRNAFYAQEKKDAVAASKRDRLTVLVLENVLEKRKKDLPSVEPVPYPVALPVQHWTLLDYSDFAVKHGIVAVGLLLLVGLFTRTACVVGATYLLLFYLAMPPLPGWPESPRAEGHYLFVNKNIIEMLALLVLATTRSGRWAGLDALLQFLRPARWRTAPAAATMEKVPV